MNLVLVKLHPLPEGASAPMSYHLATNFLLLAVKVDEARFHYRAYRPNLPFDGSGIHTSDIEQVFDLDYAKLNYPEIFL